MEILTFWLPAALITLIAAGLAVMGLLRGMRLREDGSAPAPRKREVGVYADQLREIERDVARGLVGTDEAERLRTEIARRVLEADRNQRAAIGRSPAAMRIVALGLVAAGIVLAGFVYWRAGAPMYPDQPLAQRHAQAAQLRNERPSQRMLETAWLASPERATPPEPEADFVALMEQLRAALASRPLDLQGHRLLARNEANIGNHAAAAAAQERVIALLGDEATVVEHAVLAEQMILATGGIVSPEAETVLETILRMDPRSGPGRYYSGLMFAQTGRPDLTFRLWRGLLEDSRPDAPWVPQIRANIEELAMIAGVRYTLPPLALQASRGPSEDDLSAAMEMSEEERTDMIGAMVEGLAARLGSQGGSAGDWARLISALGVLGQIERARAIWSEARLVFGEQPDQLRVIEEAARPLGFVE